VQHRRDINFLFVYDGSSWQVLAMVVIVEAAIFKNMTKRINFKYGKQRGRGLAIALIRRGALLPWRITNRQRLLTFYCL